MLRLFALALFLVMTAVVVSAPPSAYLYADHHTYAPTDNYLSFLPVVTKPTPPKGIYGYVYNRENAMVSFPVELRFYNGSSWSTLATTLTESGGLYAFRDAPSLESGQAYYVRYLNPGVEYSLLMAWLTPILLAYTAGDEVHLSDFNLQNVMFTDPRCTCGLSLPYTYKWQKRFATSDSYEFNLHSFGGAPYFYTPLLGYVGEYTLDNLPDGFNYYDWYAMEIWVYSPDGGLGISHYMRVSFEPSGSGMPSLAPATWARSFEEPAISGDESSWRMLLKGQERP